MPVALGRLEAGRGMPTAERRPEVALRMLERHVAGAGMGRLELGRAERVEAELDSLTRGQRSLLGSGEEGNVPPLI
jgi:hypothetical protein